MLQDAQIATWLSQNRSDKNSLDKAHARRDIEELETVLASKELSSDSLARILALMSGGEGKLFNFNRAERIIVLRVFVCVREVTRLLESFLKIDNKSPVEKRVYFELQQSAKFLIALYLSIARTSLSIDAMGFMESLSTKIEMKYPIPEAVKNG